MLLGDGADTTKSAGLPYRENLRANGETELPLGFLVTNPSFRTRTTPVRGLPSPPHLSQTHVVQVPELVLRHGGGGVVQRLGAALPLRIHGARRPALVSVAMASDCVLPGFVAFSHQVAQAPNLAGGPWLIHHVMPLHISCYQPCYPSDFPLHSAAPTRTCSALWSSWAQRCSPLTS